MYSPGTPGSEMTITFCLTDGTCLSAPVTVSDCTVPEEPTDFAFRFVGAGCHDTSDIYFIVDTGLAWLVPGAGFTYSASDAEGGYACSVHPTIPGRLYCSGPRPVSPGTLQVCVDQDGPEPVACTYFDDWPAQVAIIPDCAAPPPVVDACSARTALGPGECPKLPPCRWDFNRGICYTP